MAGFCFLPQQTTRQENPEATIAVTALINDDKGCGALDKRIWSCATYSMAHNSNS